MNDESPVYLMNSKWKVRRANNFDWDVKLTVVNAGPSSAENGHPGTISVLAWLPSPRHQNE